MTCGSVERSESSPGGWPRIELCFAAEVKGVGVFLLRIRCRRILVELRAPVGSRHNQHVLLGVVCGAVPLLPPESSRANAHRRPGYGGFDVQPVSERNAVDDVLRITVQEPEQSVLAGAGDHITCRPTDRCLERRGDVRDIVVVHVVGYELAVPSEMTRR